MAYYSHSKIGAYLTCPKKYEFTYVEKLKSATRGIEAFMGSRVHDALEWLYREVRMCCVPSVEDVVAHYLDAWDREWDEDVRIVRRGRTAEDYRALGEKAVRDYYARHDPFDADVTVAVEERVVCDLDGTGDRPLQGYIDRVAKVGDDKWEIHDFKTSSRLPSQEDLDADRQLALYQIALQETHPEARDVTLVWHYLTFDHEMRSKRSPEQLGELRREILADIAEIEGASEFPTRKSALCDWCEHRPVCPAWSHEARVEALDEDRLAQEPDVVLVDRYVAVTEASRALKEEREDLREAIIQRAAAEGVEALAGTDHRVTLSRSPCLKVPPSDVPEREKLEETLKEAGLWDRFSTVRVRELAIALEAEELPTSVRTAVERYVTMEESVTLRCQRRGGAGQ